LATLHQICYFTCSFQCCYNAAYAKLEPVAVGGVPMEHLISCVPGVRIQTDKLGIKKVIRDEVGMLSSPDSEVSGE